MKQTSLIGAISGMIVMVLMAIAISMMGSGCGRYDERKDTEREWSRQRNAGLSYEGGMALQKATSRPLDKRELADWAMIAQFGSLAQIQEAEKAVAGWTKPSEARDWMMLRIAAHSFAIRDEALTRLRMGQSWSVEELREALNAAKMAEDKEAVRVLDERLGHKANPAVIVVMMLIIMIGCAGWAAARVSSKRRAYKARPHYTGQ